MLKVDLSKLCTGLLRNGVVDETGTAGLAWTTTEDGDRNTVTAEGVAVTPVQFNLMVPTLAMLELKVSSEKLVWQLCAEARCTLDNNKNNIAADNDRVL